jgi:hypothetical protein
MRVWVWLLLDTHRHRSILGAAGHIILTPANQLMVLWGSNYGHCPIQVSNQQPFHPWPNALTTCANRAHNGGGLSIEFEGWRV